MGIAASTTEEAGAAINQQSNPIPLLEEWVNEEGARLEAQANKLRQAIAHWRANTDNGNTELILDHYERVLTDLEHQIAVIFPGQEWVSQEVVISLKSKKVDVAVIPRLKPICQEWVSEEVAILEAQANKLRRTIARRRANEDNDSTASIMDHYEQVLTDLEHQIARFHQ